MLCARCCLKHVLKCLCGVSRLSGRGPACSCLSWICRPIFSQGRQEIQFYRYFLIFKAELYPVYRISCTVLDYSQNSKQGRLGGIHTAARCRLLYPHLCSSRLEELFGPREAGNQIARSYGIGPQSVISPEAVRSSSGGTDDQHKGIGDCKYQTKALSPLFQIYSFNPVVLQTRDTKYSESSAGFYRFHKKWQFTRNLPHQGERKLRQFSGSTKYLITFIKILNELYGLKELAHLHKPAFSWSDQAHDCCCPQLYRAGYTA